MQLFSLRQRKRMRSHSFTRSAMDNPSGCGRLSVRLSGRCVKLTPNESVVVVVCGQRAKITHTDFARSIAYLTDHTDLVLLLL